MKAVFNGKTIAQSDQTVVVEGNHYFPLDSIDKAVISPSPTSTTCPWKGKAHYYHVTVADKTSQDSAWFYPQPSEAAAKIKDHVAFWKDVQVVEG